jgi:oligoribonuclease NrnB/cAMP/cGMP phosphodiesterase (DHH superfamily)
MKNKPLVIYHASCLDGFGAAFAFWKVFGKNADYHPGVYGDPCPDVTDRDVYMLDFGYKRNVVEGMVKFAKSVTLIDHHVTTINALADVDGIDRYTDIHQSGAVLAWKYAQDVLFLDAEIPQLIKHIQDRDLWNFELPFTKEVIAGLSSYDFNFMDWDSIIYEVGNEFLIQEGNTILRYHKKNLLQVLEECTREMFIVGEPVPCASVPYFMASDAGEILNKGKPFSATYYDTDKHRVFSLRSEKGKGWDVSAVAAQYGGGGHKHAAGFMVTRQHHLAKV